jgi:hypothetical protein
VKVNERRVHESTWSYDVGDDRRLSFWQFSILFERNKKKERTAN